MKNFWNPNKATKIASTLAIGAMVALNAAPVEAAEYRSGNIGGYRAEVLDSGSYRSADYLEVYGPNGKEQIVVTCAPFDWNSTGPNSATWVNSIAEEWCF